MTTVSTVTTQNSARILKQSELKGTHMGHGIQLLVNGP